MRLEHQEPKAVLLALTLILVFGGCAGGGPEQQAIGVPTNVEVEGPGSKGDSAARSGKLAPELTGTGRWLNSEPFTLESRRGEVVLIDFWTYSCINCIRTFPHLKKWHDKYSGRGLVILGVHTPEFRFEENFDNLRMAVADEGITWPVVQDNERGTWNAYNNLYWPSKYLIDQYGVMRYFYGGEGGYDLTEGRIRALLEERGADLSDIEFATAIDESTVPEDGPGFDPSVESIGYRGEDKSGLEDSLDPIFRDTKDAQVTSELLLGYEDGCKRNLFSNSEVADPLYCESKGITAAYQDSGVREDHRLYIQGEWLAEQENLRHTRDSKGFEDYLLLRFASKSVNVVAGFSGPAGPQTKVLVTLDGNALDESNRGEDVVIDDDGRSFLLVSGPRMYGVVELPGYGVHDVKLSSNDAGLAIYTFTFGVYAEGP